MATTAATLCGLTFIVFVCRCSGYYAGRGSLLPLDAMAAGNVPPQGDPYGLQAYQHMQPRGGVGAMGGYMTGREQQIQQRQFEQQQLQHHQLQQQQQQQQQLEQHQQLRVQQQQHQQLEQNQQLQLQQQQHQQLQLQQQQQEQQQNQQLQQQQLEQQQLQQLQQHQQLQQQQQQQQQPQQHPMFGRRPQFLGRRMFVNPGLMGLRNRNMFFRQPMINRGLIRGAGIRPPPFVYRGLMGPQQPQYIYRRLPTQPIIPIVKQPMITKPKPVIQKPIGISKKKVQGVKTGKGKSGGHTQLLPGDYSIMIGGGIGGTPRLLVKDGADTTIEGLAGKILIESGNQISFESNSIF